jgi:hypothetical protein
LRLEALARKPSFPTWRTGNWGAWELGESLRCLHGRLLVLVLLLLVLVLLGIRLLLRLKLQLLLKEWRNGVSRSTSLWLLLLLLLLERERGLNRCRWFRGTDRLALAKHIKSTGRSRPTLRPLHSSDLSNSPQSRRRRCDHGRRVMGHLRLRSPWTR